MSRLDKLLWFEAWRHPDLDIPIAVPFTVYIYTCWILLLNSFAIAGHPKVCPDVKVCAMTTDVNRKPISDHWFHRGWHDCIQYCMSYDTPIFACCFSDFTTYLCQLNLEIIWNNHSSQPHQVTSHLQRRPLQPRDKISPRISILQNRCKGHVIEWNCEIRRSFWRLNVQ